VAAAEILQQAYYPNARLVHLIITWLKGRRFETHRDTQHTPATATTASELKFCCGHQLEAPV